MSGIRRAPRRADNFTVHDNDTTNDDEISYRALGLLHHVLSKSREWRAKAENLSQGPGREGRDAVRVAMRELEKHGYLVRERVQDEKGRWSNESTFYEEPVPPERRSWNKNPVDSPAPGNPSPVDSPAPGNPASGSPASGSSGSIERKETKGKKEKGGLPFGGTSLVPGREHATTPPPDPPVTEPPAAAPAATAPPHTDPEPEYCPRHPDGTDEPCWACARLREAREAAQQAQERTQRTRAAQAHQDETQAFWAAIRACPDCDAQGYRLDNLRCRCSHEPGQAERNRQRMAEVRAELAAIKARKPAAHEDEATA